MKYVRVTAGPKEGTEVIEAGKTESMVFALKENEADEESGMCDDEAYAVAVADTRVEITSIEDIDFRTYLAESYEELVDHVIIDTITAELKLVNVPASVKSIVLGNQLTPYAMASKAYRKLAEENKFDIPFPEMLSRLGDGKIPKEMVYNLAVEHKLFTKEELQPLYDKLSHADSGDCSKCNVKACGIRKAEYKPESTDDSKEKSEQEEVINELKKGL